MIPKRIPSVVICDEELVPPPLKEIHKTRNPLFSERITNPMLEERIRETSENIFYIIKVIILTSKYPDIF